MLLILSFLFLSSFSQEDDWISSEIEQERKLQESLPKSNHPLWQDLKESPFRFDKKDGTYDIVYSEKIKSLVGKEVEVSGFMMPLEPGDKFKHFLISSKTPTCFFCPPGDPNEVIEVRSKKPIKWSSDLITVRGKFNLVSNKELGLFFQIKEGVLIK
ncbi:MAG: DUF3299 domain-containing protein [Rickettsiales bacterium]|nr:DUF3299 domain-containing protein [Rickettsiales bacterium]